MTVEATDYFITQVRKTIEYCRKEFDLTYAEAVGVLTVLAHEICSEHDEGEKEEEGNEAD